MKALPSANRKFKKGVVISNKMNKTVVVKVSRTMRHPQYNKIIAQNVKYYAHTEEPLEIGAEVNIVETRPLSKLKRWRVVSTAS